MATKIQWTDDTWNPVTGCTRVSPGCKNCYAEKLTATRLAKQPKYQGLAIYGESGPRWTGEVRLHPDVLDAPLRMRKGKKIFVCDMSDLFHKDVPFEFIDKVFAVMAICPQHTFQVLTKRPERMFEYLRRLGLSDIGPRGHLCPVWHALLNRAERAWLEADPNYMTTLRPLVVNRANQRGPIPNGPLENVWLGTSVENQDAADERIPHLLRCPARVRFLSCEPLLGPINLRPQIGPHCHCNPVSEPTPCDEYHETGRCSHTPSRIHWVIVGGESGHNARPYALEWASDIIQQCRSAGVPVFHKQCGSFPVTTNYNLHEFPDGTQHVAWGDYAAGARLKFNDSKGGKMSEWPEELRVRQFPT